MCEQVVVKVYTHFNLSFRWRSALRHSCFIPYPLDTSPGGAQGESGSSEDNKYLLSPHRISPQFLGHPIQNLVNLPIPSKETDSYYSLRALWIDLRTLSTPTNEQFYILCILLLSLRLLMSYIYIYIYMCVCVERLFLMFLDHTQRRSTVGRIPLEEWSARRRDLYLTTHDIHNRQISMPPVGFEPTISAGERPEAARLLRSKG